jgi:hypothetical protein
VNGGSADNAVTGPAALAAIVRAHRRMALHRMSGASVVGTGVRWLGRGGAAGGRRPRTVTAAAAMAIPAFAYRPAVDFAVAGRERSSVAAFL